MLKSQSSEISKPGNLVVVITLRIHGFVISTFRAFATFRFQILSCWKFTIMIFSAYRFPHFKISLLQDLTALRFHTFEISALRDFTASRFHCFEISPLSEYTALRLHRFEISPLSDYTALRLYCFEISHL